MTRMVAPVPWPRLEGWILPPMLVRKLGRGMEAEPGPFGLCRITGPEDRLEVLLLDADAVVLHLENEEVLPGHWP